VWSRLPKPGLNSFTGSRTTGPKGSDTHPAAFGAIVDGPERIYANHPGLLFGPLNRPGIPLRAELHASNDWERSVASFRSMLEMWRTRSASSRVGLNECFQLTGGVVGTVVEGQRTS
jgi:hypothetical protein